MNDARGDESTGISVRKPQGDEYPGVIRRAIAWSALNSLALRGGNLLTGIALARLLAPSAFGIYAIALTVQSIVVTLADLGLSADLVRSSRPTEREPSVASLALVTSTLLTGAMIALSASTASAFGDRAAAPVIDVLAVTLVLSGAGVVPYARLQRNFQQKQQFAVDLVGFLVTALFSIVLILLGAGPMALAVSRLLAQASTTALQFLITRTRPRFGWDRAIMRSAMGFGVPLALANMLSWALLNVDNIVVSRTLGATSLGFYVLAFNVSSWPMTAIGQAVRPVVFAAFAREQEEDPRPSVYRAVALSSAAGVPVAVLLAVLAMPLVTFVYGERWAPSAAALGGLAGFGGLRVVLDVLATYLVSRGRSRALFAVQASWIAALAPAMVVGIAWAGLAGAGWAHVVVGLGFVLPLYLFALTGAGVPVGTVLRAVARPAAAAAPVGVLAWLIASWIGNPISALLLAGGGTALLYGALLQRWIRALVSPSREQASAVQDHLDVGVSAVIEHGPPLPGSAIQSQQNVQVLGASDVRGTETKQ